MLRTFDAGTWKEYTVTEGEQTSCLIPLIPGVLFDLSVRCEHEVMVGLVTEDGQTIPMEIGKIVKLKGMNRNYAALDVSSKNSFWYQCLLSRTDEVVDPTPVRVELVQTERDVISSMIEERLKRYLVAKEVNRELTEDEKDELLLDIARGDLEFEEKPDQFGLGYEERFEEYTQRIAEQAKEEEEATPPPASSVVAGSGTPPAAVSNSSST